MDDCLKADDSVATRFVSHSGCITRGTGLEMCWAAAGTEANREPPVRKRKWTVQRFPYSL